MRNQKGELDKTLQSSLKIPLCPGLVRVAVSDHTIYPFFRGVGKMNGKSGACPVSEQA